MLATITTKPEDILGMFVEKDYKKSFEYIASAPDSWGAQHDLPHVVFVGHSETRFAKVLGTVAYICTDEDEEGKPILQKWSIRHQWKR